ncbi:hypothetical protein SAMN04487851_105147 [Prevotella sp. tc2-28]|uniref:hypothetical protein n=1 Tax=Prevotella sp. tc2-28 TaxID=1761888 RepID=UPI000895FE4B|nr:hypothetical protein [Prevotella sp. tc2-28]SEA38846.1 hypothetical protein SAMN04487851_105147 [Prevotella sp. tc2-28]
MNTFSFNRFGKMLRWVLSVNQRRMLFAIAASVVGVFMAEMILLRMGDIYSPLTMLHYYGQIGAALFALVSLILVSTIVSGVNEKRKREAFLMLPASNLEKFLALMTYTSVICVLGVFLAFVLGDSLRMVWFWISGPYTEAKVSYIGNPTEYYYWWSSAIPEMMDNLTPHILEADSCNWFYLVMNIVVLAAIAVWTHSLLIIGGTLFRKYSFVISCLVFILFWVIFGKTMQYFELSMFTSNWEDGKYVSGEVGIPAYILAVLLPLLAVFNYWASFHIFKNFQLITNKWTNYDILKR